MSSRKLYVIVVCMLIVANQVNWGDASFLDWIWPNRNLGFFGNDNSNLPAVPFELSETNDKFIHDTSNILGTKLSNLDFCQQRVILAFKKSCNILNDEEIGKLAVALLNCQLISEGREINECAEQMQLKDCTGHMTPEVWSSYNLIVGRAKATCLAIRQDQFRGLAEMTVNKMMSSVQQQLQLMNELRGSQELLEKATLTSLDEITDNHVRLLQKQSEIMQLTDVQRLGTEANIREIVKEKHLIKSGQNDLSKFIHNLREKIDESISGIENQNEETKKAYTGLLNDLSQLNEITEKISHRLDEVGHVIVEKSDQTNRQFDETLDKLNDAHHIVEEFSHMLTEIRNEFNEKVKWVEEFFGKDDTIERISIVTVHVCILLIGMICLVFIRADMVSRCMFLGAIAVNLAAVFYGFIKLDLMLLIGTVSVLLVGNILAKLSKKYNWIRKLRMSMKTVSDSEEEVVLVQAPQRNGHATLIKPESNNAHTRPDISSFGLRTNMPISSTPRLRTVEEDGARQSMGRERSSSRRSTSPVPEESRCKELTIRGSRCQLRVTYPSRDFCYIHSRTSVGRER